MSLVQSNVTWCTFTLLVALIILGFIDGNMFVVIFGVPITVPSTVVTLLARIALINDDDEVPLGDDVTIDGADETSAEFVDCRMFVRFGVI